MIQIRNKFLVILLLITSCSNVVSGYEIVINKTLGGNTLIRDDNKDVVIDPKLNLMWQDNHEAKTVHKNWEDAIDYCENLTFAGYNDWRLPDTNTLKDLHHKQAGLANVYTSWYYWSSAPNVWDFNKAWDVNFGDGHAYDSHDKSSSWFVRCVRDSKDTLAFETFDKKVERIVKQTFSQIVQEELSQIPKPYELNISQIKSEAQKKGIKKALMMFWGKPLLSNLKYDADNGYFIADLTFEAKADFSKTVAIKVDIQNAKRFKDNFKKFQTEAVFDYDGQSVSLKDIRIPNTTYTAQFTDMKINDTRVAVNLSNEYETDFSTSSTNVKIIGSQVSSFDASKLQDFKELDRLLYNTKAVEPDSKKWLFVVGIEQYEFTDNISYATRTAEMFSKIGAKKLGVPKENSFVLLNNGASQAKIKTNLQKMLNRVKAGDTIYFYYNGHGVPVANQNFEPFMLASDTEPDYVGDEKFFALNNIYGALSSSKASKVVAFVDSCFSGVTDGKSVLKGVAATKMKPKIVDFDKDKMVVITAGKDYQYSNGYDKKGYRMFSFFAMKNILSDNNTGINTLFTNIKKETYDASMSEYGDMRAQEPTIDGNQKMGL